MSLTAARHALAEGRSAALRARTTNAPLPANPYRAGTKRASNWQWGVERASRLLDQIMEIGA